MPRQEFEERIGRAQKSIQYVVICYDIGLDYMVQAGELIRGGEDARGKLQAAVDSIMTLATTLDMSRELSKDLLTLYLHVVSLLTDAANYKDPGKLQFAVKITNELRQAFAAVEQIEMKNASPAAVFSSSGDELGGNEFMIRDYKM